MGTRTSFALMTGLAISVLALPVAAQAASANHEMHHQHHAVVKKTKAPSKLAKTEATRAYEAAMDTMHRDMAQPLLGNADVDFTRQMIPHHQGAVAMAKIQLQYGKDEWLKKLNRWIIFAQEQEIGYMKNWLTRRDNGAVEKGAVDYYGEAMQKMHHGMMIDYTGDADLDYVRGMIAHHQGAVDMASILMKHGTDPDLKPLARNIFSSQTQEIGWMEGWLEEQKHH